VRSRRVPAVSSVYDFGPFRLDAAERLLLRAGQPVSLTPKALDLLVYLVEQPGRLVTKQALMSALWPDSFVEETNLTYNISALRKALGDGQDGEQFIQTVPTRGYRFVAPVARHRDDAAESIPKRTAFLNRNASSRVAVFGLVLAVLAMLPVVVRHMRETPVPRAPVRFTIPLPDSTAHTSAIVTPQISPDGRRLAFIVAHASQIFLHDLEGNRAQLVAGTEDARGLFWAPDSEHLAFSTPSGLRKIRLSDATIQTLCDSCRPAGGGTWSRSGQIVFPSVEGPLLAIAAAGGEARAITTVDQSAGETAHLAPWFLPDGQRFLYAIRNIDSSRSGVYVGQIGSAEPRRLLEGDGPAVYAAPGHLLFLRARALMVQRFDSARLDLIGEASPIVPEVFPTYSVPGQPALSVSDTGVLTYGLMERPISQFQWVGRAGEPQELVGDPGVHYTFDLSRDGRRLAYARPEGGHMNLWVLDIERGVSSRLTSAGSSYADPRWIEGDRIVATRWQPLPYAIVQIAPDGVESTIMSSPAAANIVDAVSHDGRYLLFRLRGELLAAPLSDASETFVVRSAAAGGLNQARFSPDGRLIAYREADGSGRFEVWVTPFPPTGERWQVSSGGAVQPVWREDGSELYYLGTNGTLNMVQLRSRTPPRFSAPRRLFATDIVPPSTTVEEYTVSHDGQRFLLLKPITKSRSSIGVILNWMALVSGP
jgi:eukaryotic-like serine/threonine-protein kinase